MPCQHARMYRLLNSIPDIIVGYQAGYIKGWFLASNIRNLDDIIQYSNIYDAPGIIFNMDFLKAFDLVQ